jgi:hypothetical protein
MGQAAAQEDKIAGGTDERSPSSDFIRTSMHRAPQASHDFHPAEAFLDLFADALTGFVTSCSGFKAVKNSGWDTGRPLMLNALPHQESQCSCGTFFNSLLKQIRSRCGQGMRSA